MYSLQTCDAKGTQRGGEPRQRRGGFSPFPTERLLIVSIVKADPVVLEAKESLESGDDMLHASAAKHMGFHVIFWFHH